LYEKNLEEQSYAIIAEALEALAKTNPAIALKKAKSFENEPGKKLLLAVADLYASYGDDDNFEFFVKARKSFNGYDLFSYGNLYGKFLKRCTRPATVLKGGEDLISLSKSDNQLVKYTAMKIFKNNLIDVWQEKEDKQNAKITEAKTAGKDVSAYTAELKTISDTKNKLIELYRSVK
jgi:hypothetical protein